MSAATVSRTTAKPFRRQSTNFSRAKARASSSSRKAVTASAAPFIFGLACG